MEKQKSDFIMKFKIISLENTDPPLYMRINMAISNFEGWSKIIIIIFKFITFLVRYFSNFKI